MAGRGKLPTWAHEQGFRWAPGENNRCNICNHFDTHGAKRSSLFICQTCLANGRAERVFGAPVAPKTADRESPSWEVGSAPGFLEAILGIVNDHAGRVKVAQVSDSEETDLEGSEYVKLRVTLELDCPYTRESAQVSMIVGWSNVNEIQVCRCSSCGQDHEFHRLRLMR